MEQSIRTVSLEIGVPDGPFLSRVISLVSTGQRIPKVSILVLSSSGTAGDRVAAFELRSVFFKDLRPATDPASSTAHVATIKYQDIKMQLTMGTS